MACKSHILLYLGRSEAWLFGHATRLKKIIRAGNPAADQFDDETAPPLTAKAAHPAIDNRQADRQAEEQVGGSVSDIDLRRPIVHDHLHILWAIIALHSSVDDSSLRSRLPLFSVQTDVDWIMGPDELWGRGKFRAAVALH